jgi:hypothetical protein
VDAFLRLCRTKAPGYGNLPKAAAENDGNVAELHEPCGRPVGVESDGALIWLRVVSVAFSMSYPFRVPMSFGNESECGGRTARVPRLHDEPSNFVDRHVGIACSHRNSSPHVSCSSPSFIMSVSKNDPIAIIGAGAFGLSTALELSNQGYTNITVFEKDEEIPSRWSAANDLNKIMRAEYEDDFYTDLAVVRRITVSITENQCVDYSNRKLQMHGKHLCLHHIFTASDT